MEIMELAQQTSEKSLARPGPANITGSSNYYLDILASDGSSRVAARLWVLDSMDSCSYASDGQIL